MADSTRIAAPSGGVGPRPARDVPELVDRIAAAVDEIREAHDAGELVCLACAAGSLTALIAPALLECNCRPTEVDP